MKEIENFNSRLRITLFKNIHFHIFNKTSELALKLCDFYVQKYADTIFLNPYVYLFLAEIYNEMYGLDLARLFFEKAEKIVNWQFSGGENPILIDIYYTYASILLKQGDSDEEISAEIESLLKKSLALCDKFYDAKSNEKRAKIILQLNLLKLSVEGVMNFEKIEEVTQALDFLNKTKAYKDEASYLNLFIDNLKKVVSDQDNSNDIKSKLIKR